MQGLIDGITFERSANASRAKAVRGSFLMLLLGLVMVGGEAATLAVEVVLA